VSGVIPEETERSFDCRGDAERSLWRRRRKSMRGRGAERELFSTVHPSRPPEGRGNSANTTINHNGSGVVPSRSSFGTNPHVPTLQAANSTKINRNQTEWRGGGKAFRRSKMQGWSRAGCFGHGAARAQTQPQPTDLGHETVASRGDQDERQARNVSGGLRARGGREPFLRRKTQHQTTTAKQTTLRRRRERFTNERGQSAAPLLRGLETTMAMQADGARAAYKREGAERSPSIARLQENNTNDSARRALTDGGSGGGERQGEVKFSEVETDGGGSIERLITEGDCVGHPVGDILWDEGNSREFVR